MRLKVENVVIWRARAVPGERIIPKHLKLAILSRGRIDVPSSVVAPIIQAAQARGAQWIDRLTTPFERIYPKVHLVTELFLIQRSGMTPDQIDESIAAYLVERKAKAYPHCAVLEWMRAPLGSVQDVRDFEKSLQLDLRRLLARPRVTIPGQARSPRHLLLAYFCLPIGLNRFLKPDPNLTEPLLPAPLFQLPTRLDSVPRMEPLEGRTDPRDELNVRDAPNSGARSLGVLAGHEAKVRILDKFDGTDGEGEALTWFQIETLEPLSVTEKMVSRGPSPRKSISTGTKAWIAAGGIKIAAASWSAFRRDLREWEANEPLMSPVDTRITKLRQMSHRKNLIFDEVIGTAAGTTYLDDLIYVANRWQMFRDYEAVIAPDGRWVDLQHIFVGLDVLTRREREVEVSKYRVSFNIGTNWASATWAGDLGSAVGDSQTQGTGAWSSYANPRTLADYMDFYLQASAADWDLLGDLDAWGIRPILEERRDVVTVDDLLSLYYEDVIEPILDLEASPQTGCPLYIRPIVRRRIDALTRFLVHYGFRFPSQTDDDQNSQSFQLLSERLKALDGQKGGKRIAKEVHRFAEVWRAYRDPPAYVLLGTPFQAALDEDQAVRYFVEWLTFEAIMHCVKTHSNGPGAGT